MRLLTAADMPRLMEIVVQPNVLEALSFEMRRPTVEEVISGLTLAAPGTRTEVFGIAAGDGKLLGTVALADQHPVNRNGFLTNLTLIKGAPFGAAMAAVRWILDHGFNVRNLHRIECIVWDSNRITPILAKRIKGLVLEGKRRQAVWRQGRYMDITIYGLLREDYGKRN